MSSYKHSHVMDNGLVYTPNDDTVSVAELARNIAGVADSLHDNWYAIPADKRYAMTGSRRALEEAVADGSLNPDGTRTMDIDGFKQWRAMGNTGDYQDYQYEKKLQQIQKVLKDSKDAPSAEKAVSEAQEVLPKVEDTPVAEEEVVVKTKPLTETEKDMLYALGEYGVDTFDDSDVLSAAEDAATEVADGKLKGEVKKPKDWGSIGGLVTDDWTERTNDLYVR